MSEEWINVAGVIPGTRDEGPGLRSALWVQGCSLRCPACCNPHLWHQRPARLARPAEIAEEMLAAPGIEGVTLLGGEPFEQAAPLAELARLVREAGMSVMVFSGYTLAELRARPRAAALLARVDLLVDGRYEEARRVTDRRWIGSSNQEVHVLSDRYRHLDEPRGGAWDDGANVIELRLRGSEITINGFPFEGAVP